MAGKLIKQFVSESISCCMAGKLIKDGQVFSSSNEKSLINHAYTAEIPYQGEKDLHVNVGRLIKFLVYWESDKHRLFEKIMELSYAMAEEVFWTEKDLKFTAAWIQDLISVGYLQSRLMTLELHRPRATIGHGDRKDFVAQKLPFVHLGVEETGTVNGDYCMEEYPLAFFLGLPACVRVKKKNKKEIQWIQKRVNIVNLCRQALRGIIHD
ncbi:hypothetical protein L1887_18962 [Cichorium endivia]|nr:hypothetical protein L1887_18962 [Cichorium endivia]